MNKTPFQAGMCRNSLAVVITLLFSVSVSDCTNVTAKVGGKVILPCNCPNMSSLISWQRDHTIVYSDDRDLTALQYRGRTGIQENSCSLILSQVRASDEGVYTCYYDAEAFSDVHATLQVTANFITNCTNRSGSYHCKAIQGYPEGKIAWKLNGQLLFPHPVFSYSKMDSLTGLYDIESSVSIKESGTVTCEVEISGLAKEIAQCVTGPHMQRALEVFWNVPVVSVVCGSLVVLLIWLSVWIIKRQNRRNETRDNQPELWSLKDKDLFHKPDHADKPNLCI
ncbi:CD276 antigen homolog [Colossoma macropomum]|uniref:CD276 antigen homolog n=1 Tax=Colossoma macropomum TaxID=42526 RepID=UPI0018654111|nr:CD276 antigen homolog [Colossoma macropomum]